MSWAELSFEITLEIFGYFDPYSFEISQLQLTCKKWLKSAQKIRYTNLTIQTKKDADDIVQLLRSTPNRLGHLIKFLDLKNLFDNSSVWDSEDYMTTFAKKCPKIEHIRITKPRKEFWMKLIHDRFYDRWQLLKTINFPTTDDGLMHYNCTMSIFRKTITSLLLCESLQRVEADKRNTKDFKTLARHLKEFIRLQKLSIRIHTEISLSGFDEYIQNCNSTLERLEITAYQPELMTYSADEINLSEVEQRSNIKYLSVNMSVYNNESLAYLMHKFPSLQQLSLNKQVDKMMVSLLAHSMFSLSAEMRTAFFQYLSRIPKISLQYITTDRIIDICRVYKESFKNTTIFKLRYLEPVSVRREISAGVLHIESVNKNDTTNTSTAASVSTDKPMIIEAYLGTYTEQMPLSHIDIVELLGDSLETIEFGYEAINNAINIVPCLKQRIGYSMDNMFGFCPRLKRLLLENLYLDNCNPEIQINKSVENLVIRNCIVNDEFLFELSIRLPKLKHLVLERITLLYENRLDSGIIITMPYTSFESFYWIKKTTDGYNKMHFKISSADKEKYFIAQMENGSLIEECDVSTFKNVPIKQNGVKVHIRCRELLNLYVEKPSIE
ncbi:MAG: hypothetical protein EXX96DRAFT_68972 [Benjaminiella poitrasii]|nr:MAG: hypothetical protein EXX96DRAFT_68972 [Benjaminiella poitrasii]